jgi:hypothetical protein
MLDFEYVGVNASRGCKKMRVWPFGVGLQEPASKNLKLLWSKAMVVSNLTENYSHV